tara:strand:- start:4441 stop:4557 length:117 start_codon:yes stop_codon:yes gene_type:complete
MNNLYPTKRAYKSAKEKLKNNKKIIPENKEKILNYEKN